MAMSKTDLEEKIALLKARAPFVSLRGGNVLDYLAIHAEIQALVGLLQKRFPPKPRKRAKVAEGKIEAWFTTHVAGWTGDAYPSETDQLSRAKDELGGHIPRDVFRRLRLKIVPSDWRRAGRRRKASADDRPKQIRGPYSRKS
jgi:hypothetical protein